MTAKLYAIGVGPGDPQLLTLKAVNLINEADVIACPAKDNTPGVAYQIALAACPVIEQKEMLLLDFPMKKSGLEEYHKKAAKSILSRLHAGKNVAFLTLGDPGFYSSFSYISKQIREEGYEIETVSGVPSFCAAAARCDLPLAIGEEKVLITAGEYQDHDGTLIVMKAGSRLKEMKEQVLAAGKSAWLIENCGMPDERVYSNIDSMPDQAGYFSMLIIK